MRFGSGSMLGKGLGTTRFGNRSDVVYVLVAKGKLFSWKVTSLDIRNLLLSKS